MLHIVSATLKLVVQLTKLGLQMCTDHVQTNIDNRSYRIQYLQIVSLIIWNGHQIAKNLLAPLSHPAHLLLLAKMRIDCLLHIHRNELMRIRLRLIIREPEERPSIGPFWRDSALIPLVRR